MQYEWDEAKRQTNITKHHVDFCDIEKFVWESAHILEDNRFDYRERRWLALGYINERVYSIAFTLRDEVVRLISLRKANKREVKLYERNT